MGQRDGFSRSDIAKINAMYSCKGVTNNYQRPAAQAQRPTQRPTQNPVANWFGNLISGFSFGDEEGAAVNGTKIANKID